MLEIIKGGKGSMVETYLIYIIYNSTRLREEIPMDFK
jgi:hypothetical protein